MTTKAILPIFKKSIIMWWNNDAFTQSAAIAYYTIFSFPALMILYFAAASVFVDQEVIQQQVYGFMGNNFGEDSATQFRTIVEKTAPEETSSWAIFLGGGVLLYTGMRLFLQLQKALNQIWNVDESKLSNMRKLVVRRMTSFSVMLAIAFTLVVSLVATSLLTALTEFIMHYLPDAFAILFHAINFLFSLGVLTLMFAVLLKKLPDTRVQWSHALWGAALSALLFVLGEYAMSMYFSIAKPGSAYGVTGSIILMMLWVSYSCVILLLGAQFSRELQRAKDR